MSSYCVYCGSETDQTKKIEGVFIPICSGAHWDKYVEQENLYEGSKGLKTKIIGLMSNILGKADIIAAAVLIAALLLSEKYLLALIVFLVFPPYSAAWEMVFNKWKEQE